VIFSPLQDIKPANNSITATEEEIKEFSVLMQKFQLAYPHWKGPMQPVDSVKMQKKVIDNMTMEQTGQFLSHRGDKSWL
jgi:hypothetical protein